jgi:hypothetical protein
VGGLSAAEDRKHFSKFNFGTFSGINWHSPKFMRANSPNVHQIELSPALVFVSIAVLSPALS